MLLLPSYSTWRFTTTGRDCTSSVDGLDSLAWRLDLQATAMTPVGSGGNIGKADLPPSLTHILDGDSRCSWKAINYHQLSWHVAWTLRKNNPATCQRERIQAIARHFAEFQRCGAVLGTLPLVAARREMLLCRCSHKATPWRAQCFPLLDLVQPNGLRVAPGTGAKRRSVLVCLADI